MENEASSNPGKKSKIIHASPKQQAIRIAIKVLKEEKED
jgi:hypothetical protein